VRAGNAVEQRQPGGGGEFTLSPNPFNPQKKLSYKLGKQGRVILEVCNKSAFFRMLVFPLIEFE
jgi:hypothetical protein